MKKITYSELANLLTKFNGADLDFNAVFLDHENKFSLTVTVNDVAYVLNTQRGAVKLYSSLDSIYSELSRCGASSFTVEVL